MIRYRTHDLTRLLKGDCPAASPTLELTPLSAVPTMIKVKGVNIFPGQIDEVLRRYRLVPAANTR